MHRPRPQLPLRQAVTAYAANSPTQLATRLNSQGPHQQRLQARQSLQSAAGQVRELVGGQVQQPQLPQPLQALNHPDAVALRLRLRLPLRLP